MATKGSSHGPQSSEAPPKIDNRRIGSMLRSVRSALEGTTPPVVTLIAEAERDPFKVLLSTILSARTKDEVTAAASNRLFREVGTAEQLAAMPVRRLEKLIYPVGFYKTKARSLKKTGQVLLERFDGRVPDTIEELVELPGVGRKTANLVLTEGFQKDAVCVDTHVHRITNLWGYVDTADPEETEMALRERLPRRYWQSLNAVLVSFGQQICVPASPKCSQCPVEHRCPKIGVKRSR